MTDDNGAIPLPTGKVKVLFNPLGVNDSTPQPEAQQLASFEAIPNDDCPNGKILDINQQFVVYAVKNALIRVLHRQSTLKCLLRGHEGSKVTDIQYFNQGDVLGTVGGNVIIWRIFERSPEILAEKLMEIPATLPNITRLKWHPFNPNQFWLFHRNGEGKTVATLVESTRMRTVKHKSEGHAVCVLHDEYAVMEGAIQLSGGANVTDLDWSSGDARHVMTTHDDGTIRLWDIKIPSASNNDGTIAATCKAILQDSNPVTRGFFLPHENLVSADGASIGSALTTCFCTATKGSSEITVWSPFTESAQPTKLQIFGIDEKDAAYNLAYVTPPAHVHTPGESEPPAFFFMLSDRKSGKIFALHLKSMWSYSTPKRPIAIGFDYIVPFMSKFATYSWAIAGRPAENAEEDYRGGVNFDILICALQTKAVQHMVVPHYMCFPPLTEWEGNIPAVISLPLEVGTAHVVESVEYEEYDDDYFGGRVHDDDGDDNEDYSGPEASSLPTPEGIGIPADENPFANWLGAIANQAGVAGQPHVALMRSMATSRSPPPVPKTPCHTPAVTPLIVPVAGALPPGLIGAVSLPHLPEKHPILHVQPSLLSPVQIMSGNGDTSGQKKKSQRDRSPKNAKPKKEIAAQPQKITILKKEFSDPDSSNVPLAPIPLQTTSMVPSVAIAPEWEESLTKVMTAQFKIHEKQVADEVQRRVKSEIQITVLPEIAKVIALTIEQSILNPLQASVDKALVQSANVHIEAIMTAISGSVEQPLKEAFTESMKSTLIPAYESTTREIMSQISASVLSVQSVDASPDLSGRVDEMAMAIEALTAEISQLRSILKAQGPPPESSRSVPVPPSPADQMEAMRIKIMDDLDAKKI